MQLELATAEYIGAREQQQDLAAALPLATGALLVLADGLGGHESGAEASRIVVTTFKEAGAAGRFKNPSTRRQALREALDLANARIAEGVDPSHGHRGMASTVVAAVVANGDLSWVSVGDSHLYVWRDGRLHKLNEDHSQAGLMVRSGQYQPTDPEVQAVKSVLVSALTGRKLEIVDLPQSSFRIAPGDVLMLASDGLNTLSDAEIERIVEEVRDRGAIKLSTTLLESVRSRRIERQDNTTVVIARVLEPEPVTAVAEPVRKPEVATADAIDDSDEERTQRITSPEDEGATAKAATKPVARSTPAPVGDHEPAADVDTEPETSAPAPEQDPSPASQARRPEASKSPGLKPTIGRPERPRPASIEDRPGSEPLRLGAAPPDPSDLVLRPRSTEVAESPPPLRSRLTQGVLIVVLLLLVASGVAVAALKPEWLSAVLPRFGESGAPPSSQTDESAATSKAESTPNTAKQAVPAAESTTPSAAATPEASKAAAPLPVPSLATPPSPAAEPPGRAQTDAVAPAAGPSSAPASVTNGESSTGAAGSSAAQSSRPAAADPPLVEPEKPAVRPGGRGRAP